MVLPGQAAVAQDDGTDPRPLAGEATCDPSSSGPLPAFGARILARLPGLGVVAALTVVASALGHLLPVVGSPVLAIVGGIVIAAARPPRASWQPGITFTAKAVLQASIVVLGTGLSLHQVVATGVASLPVLLGTLGVALAGSAVVGKSLSIDRDLRTLVGVGKGVCGASAIAATDAVISATEVDVSYAIATIFTFNVLAVLTFPTIGRSLGLGPHSFGLWAGTAVNDMSSVVAAASIFGHGATSSAVVVKLTRTLMIVPIAVGLAFWRARRSSAGETARSSALGHVRRVFPSFIAWFLAAVLLNSAGLVPSSMHGILSASAQVMITAALGAIGLSTRAKDIRKAGFRPLALGAILWVLVASTSLGLQAATGSIH